MSKNFPELTDKMEYLFTDIIGSLGQLPIEQRGYLFGYEDEEDIEWIMGMACYITMEYIKYAFDYDDPTYSLRHFLSHYFKPKHNLTILYGTLSINFETNTGL